MYVIIIYLCLCNCTWPCHTAGAMSSESGPSPVDVPSCNLEPVEEEGVALDENSPRLVSRNRSRRRPGYSGQSPLTHDAFSLTDGPATSHSDQPVTLAHSALYCTFVTTVLIFVQRNSTDLPEQLVDRTSGTPKAAFFPFSS